MLELEQPGLFDYGSLDDPTRAFVQEKVRGIHARLKRTAEDIVAIGQDLLEVKARLSYGHFVPWLQSEFEMTPRSAQRFMQVAGKFGSRNDKLSFLPASVLYELAAPSTPDTIVQMVETGQIAPTLSAIREAKQQPAPIILVPAYEPELAGPKGYEPWKAERAEEGHYQAAVDMGTLDYYYDDLRRDAIQRDEVECAKKQQDAHTLRVMGSSESPEWYTPQEVIDRVLACFGEIDLDPCSNSHERPAVPARTLYTREDDGLSQPWYGKLYLNPPYGSEIPEWVEKMVQAYEDDNVEEAIALLPGRIDTNWFQPLYAYLICNVHGRLQFANSPYHSPFPAVIVYLGRRSEKFIEAFKGLGPIMRRIG